MPPPRVSAKEGNRPAQGRQASARWVARGLLALCGVMGLTLLSGLFWHVGRDGLRHSLQLLGPWLLPFVLLDSLSLWLHTLGWVACFPPAQRRPSLWYLCALRQAGSTMSWATPTATLGGEVAKVLWLETTLSRTQAAASVAIDRASFLAAQVLYLALGLLCLLGSVVLPQAWRWSMYAALLLLLLGLLACLACQYYGLLSYGLRWLDARHRLPALLQRYTPQVLAFETAMMAYYAAHPWRFLRAVGYHGLALLFDGVQTYVLLLLLLGAQAPGLGQALLVAVAVTAIDQLFFFVPAHLGTLEASRFMVMAGLGATPVHGLTFGLVARLHSLFWHGCGFLGALLAYRCWRQQRSHLAPQAPDAVLPG
ncbi:MAG: lysylphosphatidylglycerol synthase domain-containing protein [Candidatus Tectimicrobiota bacterium]